MRVGRLGGSQEASQEGRRILLIEDNPGDAGLIVELMAQRRLPDEQVLQVPTLAAALQTLKMQSVQAVLLDLHLPDGQGEACVARLRNEAGTVPIVALTGSDDEALALRCIAAGAQDYLPKQDMRASSLRRAIELAIARMQELTERQRADALQVRLAAIVESSRDAIVSCSVDGHITSWNHAAEQLFGYAREQALGRRVGEVIRPQDGTAGAAGERRFFQPRLDAGPSGAEEVVRLRADGTSVTLSVVTSTVRDEAGGTAAIAAIFRDVTESRRRDDELRHLLLEQTERERRMRALTARLNTLREEERTRISREVHDGLGQLLTGLKMDIRWMARRLAAGAAPHTLQERLAQTEELLAETISTVQRIAVELRPSALDALGLPAAIRDEARRFEARSGIQTRLDLDRAQHVEPSVATALFRILQELLANVARHARASSLDITLAPEDDAQVLQVRDDGIGIQGPLAADTGTQSLYAHLGLLGMAERAQAVGGRLSLAPHPAGGTVATVRVPMFTASQA